MTLLILAGLLLMARARNAGPALITSVDSELEEIKRWYREFLENTAPPTDLEWEPVRIGPTWQWDNGWSLPEASLGWDFMAWCGRWLRAKNGGPWKFTAEQARFLIWFFALESNGDFLYHSAVLQRLKGWGKDPLAATLAIGSLCAPTIFDHWDGDRPVGRDNPTAWVQLLAVSQLQTQNTMKLFPSLVSPEARQRYGIQIGKRNVWAMGDERQIEAVTNSVMAIEGGRPTLIVRNETQNWNSSNGGHDMAGAIEGNAAKSAKDSPARILDICNAYRPGEDSVGQRAREAYESTVGDDAQFNDFGVMYDSLEAPEKAPLTLSAAPGVVRAVRGDATWLDAEGRIKKSIANPTNTPSESRRKWYNQITAAEDSWTEPAEWDPLKDADKVLELGEEVTIFLDCSKSDDATALMGTRMSDGHVFTIQMWQRPPGKRGDGWLAPREEVDAKVIEMFDKYTVVGFFGDPSHTLDDETMDRYWDPLFNEWHIRYRHKLRVWASGSKGSNSHTSHSVMFDMSARDNSKQFANAVAYTLEEIKSGAFTHDGDARLRRHVLNSRRYPVQGFVSIAKDGRESKNKIDLAICMVGARMVRRILLTQNKKGGGRIW